MARNREGWDGWATNPTGTSSKTDAVSALARGGEIEGIRKGSKVTSTALDSDKVHIDYDDPDGGGGGEMEVTVRWHCGGEISWNIIEHKRRQRLDAAAAAAAAELAAGENSKVNVEEISGVKRGAVERPTERPSRVVQRKRQQQVHVNE